MSTLVDFSRVKELASFEPVLAYYGLTMTGRGDNRAILCPFHEEKNPSCKVDFKKKIFHCFGCKAKGNILDFVARKEGCDLPTAARVLAECCGFELPVRDGGGSTRAEPREKVPKETDTKPSEEERDEEKPVNAPLTFTLRLDPEHPYLGDRGVSPEVVETFGLGFCNRGLMKGRICIPIRDEDGALVAYAGRWPGEEGWPEGEDKYKLPPGFMKTAVLYNLDRVRGVSHLVLVEGYWSVFKLFELGVPAVALMGSSMSNEQIALLARSGVTLVTLLLDDDKPGQEATEVILPSLTRHFYVWTPELPEGASPDELSLEELGGIVDSLV